MSLAYTGSPTLQHQLLTPTGIPVKRHLQLTTYGHIIQCTRRGDRQVHSALCLLQLLL